MLRVFPVATLISLVGLLLSASTTRSTDVRLLPADTEIVLTINIKQIMESELVKGHDIKTLVQSNPLGGEVMKFLKQMHFDPFTHVRSITLAHNGKESLGPGDGFALIEGVFDVKKFHQTAAIIVEAFPQATRMCYRFRGVPVYEIEILDKLVFCALVNDKSFVLAPRERALKAAMIRATADKVEAAKVAPMLKAVKDKQIVNLVVTGDAAARLIRFVRPNGIPGIDLANIRSVTAGMTLNKEITFHVTVANKDKKSAKEMAAAGTLGLFAVRTLLGNAAKEPGLAPLIEVVDTLKMTAEGESAVLSGTISQKNIESLVQRLTK
jgi:hypothetical protein